MMMKSQETMAIYKKYKINPLMGCLMAFIQLPLFFAFLEAINRVPAIFEEKLFGLQLGTNPVVGIGNGNYIYIVLSFNYCDHVFIFTKY
jgi:membrane protein insertase Oxa1/YidC/SpoIIIJ